MSTEPDPANLSSVGEPGAPLRSKVYELIKTRIRDGEIRPGDRLLETQVVKAFGVSRSPARLALQALCHEGLIETDGRRGYTVAGSSQVADRPRLAPLRPMKVTHSRQWERIYSSIEQEILAKILFTSVRINDAQLAEFWNVSRTVTRDILARMHGVGLITKNDSGHWIARKVTPTRIEHLYELRRVLEPVALVGAAPFVPESLLLDARLQITHTLGESPIESVDFDQAEDHLHVKILRHSPNTEILHALRRTHILFGPTRHLLDPILGIPLTMIEDALHEHLAIIDCLLDGVPQEAAMQLERHLADAVARWLRRFRLAKQTQGLELPPYLIQISD